jgi:hypothetical protein
LALIGLVAPLASHAADIDVFGDSAYSVNSFASTNGGIDGGLGTNIRVINGTNVTWTKNNTYFVTDKLFIPRGATLTIEPGTKVYFSVNTNGTPTDRSDDRVGAITACRGGKLIADGTAAEPIVFTSVREWEAANNVDSPFDPDTVIGPAPTAADAGQWGGIILLGQAFVSFVDAAGANTPTVQIEGFAPTGSATYDDPGVSIPDATQYGSSTNFPRNDNDNSGIVRYCSIRHGGYEFTSGREINGLTLGGVGRGTTIEFVEVYANQDDGIEFFGGTVNTKNIVMAFNQDDSFDMDEAYNGVNQFWFGIQNPGAADGGFESDGVGNNSGGYLLADQRNESSNPKIYNATIVGPGRSNTLSLLPVTTGTVNWEKGNHAMIIEDRFAGEIYNSVFDDFSGDLIRFVDSAASTGAKFAFRNNTVGRFGNTAQKQIETSTLTLAGASTTSGGTLNLSVTSVATSGTVTVPVTITTGMNRAAVTTAIRNALLANSSFAAVYDVLEGAAGQNIIQSKVAGASAQDGTLNINIPGSFGITAQASSSNTQSGTNSSVTTNNALTYITSASGADLNFVYDSLGQPIDGNSAQNTDPMFTTYTRDGNSFLTAINPVPQSGSPLLTSSVIAGAPVAANYRGAFGTSGNWAAGWTKLSQSLVMQGSAPAAAIVDADGDGISDTLEATPKLAALGFSASVNNVSNNGGVSGANLFDSLYTSSSIQDLRGSSMLIQANGTGPVTLTLPLFKSDNLINWTAAGNLTGTTPFVPGKQFYRIDVSTGVPNPPAP